MSPNEAPQQEESEAPSFELEQADIYGKYMLSAHLDILFILRSMQKRGCMATVYFDHGKSFFLTWILAIGKNERSIILDLGSDPATNRKVLEADHLIVSANLDHVKIQFSLSALEQTTHEGEPAFLAAVPDRLLRLQRREYFRLETSLTNPVRCEVAVPREGRPAHVANLGLLDISGGGLSLMAPTETADHFRTGMLLASCRLQIPDENVIIVNLCVRSAFPVMSRSGHEYFRVGCEYVNLPGAHLNMIQRYITRVERERKARESGLD